MTKIEIDLEQYMDKNIADLKIGVLKELEKILLYYEVYSDGRYQEWPYRPFEKTIGDEKNQDIIKRIEVVAK
ncbi:hypothetical protein AB1A65_14410 [Muricauda sp. ANG21]|uniref:hypothetical protein n=1 Tax=Allomuricauda sp. ANG21 TaxID=3042468 RepID=UPI0034512A91